MFAKMASMPLLRDTPGCCWESIDSRPFFFTVLHQAPTKKFFFLFFLTLFLGENGRQHKKLRERTSGRMHPKPGGEDYRPTNNNNNKQHQDLSGRQGECILLVEGKRDRSEKDHSAGG
jgi:hypothetical protein